MEQNHFIVCGLGRFGLSIVELLTKAGKSVAVITTDECPGDRCVRAESMGARVVQGDFRIGSVRNKAGLSSAAAVLLTTSNNVANLEVALEVRGDHPEIIVVLRFAEQKLAKRLEQDFGITAVLSPAVLAAGTFVDAALQPTAKEVSEPTKPIQAGRRRVRYEFLAIPLILLLVYVSAVIVFRTTLKLSWIDAAYFTTSIVTTVGFGDFNLEHAPAWLKLFGIGLMFAGIMLIGIIASLLTLFIVSGKAMELRNEFLALQKRDHVIVCGLGQVGVAITRDLLQQGVPVVAVDPAAIDEDHQELNLQCPLIAGNATKTTILQRAGITKARAIVVCTSNDALNLEIGLTAQTAAEAQRAHHLRVVMRCFNYDLADRIHRVSDDYILLSEATIAAPLFASAAIQTTGATGASDN
ncbi:MAG: NAD-binding protein [Pirellulales bacterium]